MNGFSKGKPDAERFSDHRRRKMAAEEIKRVDE
jgi:hypothetical protein